MYQFWQLLYINLHVCPLLGKQTLNVFLQEWVKWFKKNAFEMIMNKQLDVFKENICLSSSDVPLVSMLSLQDR